jgi:hypothetical protein
MDKEQIKAVLLEELHYYLRGQDSEFIEATADLFATKLVDECEWTTKVSAGYSTDRSCPGCDGPIEEDRPDICYKCHSMFTNEKTRGLLVKLLTQAKREFEFDTPLEVVREWHVGLQELTEEVESELGQLDILDSTSVVGSDMAESEEEEAATPATQYEQVINEFSQRLCQSMDEGTLSLAMREEPPPRQEPPPRRELLPRGERYEIGQPHWIHEMNVSIGGSLRFLAREVQVERDDALMTLGSPQPTFPGCSGLIIKIKGLIFPTVRPAEFGSRLSTEFLHYDNVECEISIYRPIGVSDEPAIVRGRLGIYGDHQIRISLGPERWDISTEILPRILQNFFAQVLQEWAEGENR